MISIDPRLTLVDVNVGERLKLSKNEYVVKENDVEMCGSVGVILEVIHS